MLFRSRIIIKHLYIERRMVPLNIFLANAERAGDEGLLEHGVFEYGNAIRDLVAANIFPGDMMFKNFGRMVEKLRRVKIAFLELDVAPGRYRLLTPKEVLRFRKILKLDVESTKSAHGED